AGAARGRGAPDAAAPGPGRQPGAGGRRGAGHAAGRQHRPGRRAAGAGRIRRAAAGPDGAGPAGLPAARRRLGQLRQPADRPALDLRLRRLGRSHRAHLTRPYADPVTRVEACLLDAFGTILTCDFTAHTRELPVLAGIPADAMYQEFARIAPALTDGRLSM